MSDSRPTIMLVKPPERSMFNFGAFSLAVLAASIRDIAEVKIIDATALSIQSIVSKITSYRPDWVGITTMSISSLKPVCNLIKAIRRATNNINIVIGGHGASMIPWQPLLSGANLVIRGEGESSLRTLLMKGLGLDTSIPGICILENGVLRQNPLPELIEPLDLLQFPARDLMPKPENRVFLMETSRGCPHTCSFCETTRFYGCKWRGFSTGRVIAEIQRLIHDFDAWVIEITDDNFTANYQRVIDICEALKAEDLPALFMVSARADDLIAHTPLLHAMAENRMLRISIGVETLSPSLAKKIKKYIPLKNYQILFEKMRSLGMFSVASFIVGLPGESKKDRKETLRKALLAAPDAAQFIPFYPLPCVSLSGGCKNFNPSPDAIYDAKNFTRAFYTNDFVRKRLLHASQGKDIRAMLSAGTLEKYKLFAITKNLPDS